MASAFSKDYSVGDLRASKFGVENGDGEGGVGHRTTHLTYQKVN